MSVRLAGHELLREGAPYSSYGVPNTAIYSYTTSGTGCGKCSCGALSPEFSSGNKRKQWHREHKAEIRAEQDRTP